ncbi:hypothetical protein [Burkholderia thailandensis]|uniref:hypothetical protein n=1 Tax=Burkholderia thailandensis TaxID=57975 RepID=UPI00217DBF00|nr:hypothetical protein [Burkholderia thailandensis]MCS6515146.1 hypothetical protein [Burkholderia thailandensis]
MIAAKPTRAYASPSFTAHGVAALPLIHMWSVEIEFPNETNTLQTPAPAYFNAMYQKPMGRVASAADDAVVL